jgi:predicted aspartyl protease
VPIAEMPLEATNRLLTVPVGINGHWTRMLVDTGAERTTVSEDTALRLGLSRDPHYVSRSGGVGGTTVHPDVRIDGLVLGGVDFPVERLAVSRFGQGLSVDGLLGADVLLAFDLDIDVAGSRMTFYRVRRCPEAAPPWHEPALPIHGIAARKDRMLIPVELDGVAGAAVLDTGAQATAIGIDMARRTGLTDAALASDPVMPIRGVGTNTLISRLHRFRSLRVGPVMHRDVDLPVLPGDVGIGDALVGQDFLRERRVWLSFPTRRMFVSQRAEERAARQ